MQILGEMLGIGEQFQGVDELKIEERTARCASWSASKAASPSGLHLRRRAGRAAAGRLGNLPEPPNNPQVGMMNMRAIMPALQKAKPVKLAAEGTDFRQRRSTQAESARRASSRTHQLTQSPRKSSLGSRAELKFDSETGPFGCPGFSRRMTFRLECGTPEPFSEQVNNHARKRDATMETILFLTHTESDGSLAKAALETLTHARNLAGRTRRRDAVSAGLYRWRLSRRRPVSGRRQRHCENLHGVSAARPSPTRRYASDAAAATAHGSSRRRDDHPYASHFAS